MPTAAARSRTATPPRRRSSSSSRARRRSSSGPRRATRAARDEEIPLRAGHVVARPPGTRVSHSFRAGPDGVTMLIYGTRDANDICWYPRSQQDLLARRRRDRPDRAARLLRRRAGRGRLGVVAYDEELADRIRTLLGDRAGLTEQKMFGGLAFLIGGNMAIAASGEGGILVRVDPGGVGRARRDDAGRADGDARPADGRLAPCRRRRRADDAALAAWVERGAGYAASLPPK